MTPAYLKLYKTGELFQRIDDLTSLLRCCTLCPHSCQVDRAVDCSGVCRCGQLVPVEGYAPHFGEERPLVGKNGSGTIFFGGCNLHCSFCQNYDISHIDDPAASKLNCSQLAEVMLMLQQEGCHNINLVTPTHVIPQIVAALPDAIELGLKLPLIYNSSGYDSLNTLKLLDGIIDIYMPDMKFLQNSTAARYTEAENYPEVARLAIKEMSEQVGNLVVDDRGIALRGLLVRHLVMPGHSDESVNILRFLSDEISERCSVNIMDQYHPCGKPPSAIDRPLSRDEYEKVLNFAKNTRLVLLHETRLADLLKQLGIVEEKHERR